MQVVRTFDKMFAPATEGEQGVLEAYLRAIHLAERFIYIENQYFNNDTITEALVAALKKKPALQLILLLNACPDMPLYMDWQQKAIKRILGSFGDATTPRSASACSAPGSTRPRSRLASRSRTIVDIYLHTKSALIDNRWATVGSANLDGASLDFIQYARAFFDSDVRNTEANLVVFEDAGTIVSAVDALRRRLWAEHLGFSNPADTVARRYAGQRLGRRLARPGRRQASADSRRTSTTSILLTSSSGPPRTSSTRSVFASGTTCMQPRPNTSKAC